MDQGAQLTPTLQESIHLRDLSREHLDIEETAQLLPKPSSNPLTQHASLTSSRMLDNGPKFATIEFLKPYLPSIDTSDDSTRSFGSILSNRIAALSLQLTLTVLVLCTNIFVIRTALDRWDVQNGTGTVYEGSCHGIKFYGTVLHILINIMSTLLLGASNFSAQILSAPSRKDLDKCHAKQVALDIGVQSVKNLRFIRSHRVVVWTMLVLSTAPLHLLWNSAVFSSFAFVSYEMALVTRDFDTNNLQWALNGSDYLRQKASHFQRISPEKCARLYVDPLSGAGDVVVVTNMTKNSVSYNDGSSLLHYNNELNPNWDWRLLGDWVCTTTNTHQFNGNWKLASCAQVIDSQNFSQWTIFVPTNSSTSPEVLVDHCLTSRSTPDIQNMCGLHVNIRILMIVCGMNIIKCFGVLYTLGYSKVASSKPLTTVGDCIESFLDEPDIRTKDLCLQDWAKFRDAAWPKAEPIQWKGARKVRKFQVSNVRSWAFTLLSGCALVLVAGGLLASALMNQHKDGESITPSAIWNRGFDHSDGNSLAGIFIHRSKRQFWYAVMFANSWQLEISCLYMLYNYLLTKLSVVQEWNEFAEVRRFLRVSSPKGLQQSTYFLSLPMKYGILGMIGMTMIHLCVSEAVFLVQARAFTPEAVRKPIDDSSRIGFSGLGIILAMVSGSIMLLALVIIGFRKINLQAPMVGTNSAAISASCQRPMEDVDAGKLPVKWGVVSCSNQDGVGHCSLSTLVGQEPPEPGRYYM